MSLFSCSFIFVLAQEAAFFPHLSPVGPAAEEPARGRFQKKGKQQPQRQVQRRAGQQQQQNLHRAAPSSLRTPSTRSSFAKEWTKD